MFTKIIAFTLGFLVVAGLVALICFALAWPFMWMWNYAVVKAISVSNTITYWPAFWLMLFISMFCIGASNVSAKSKS